MLAGQGSQYYSMGRDLYEKMPSFRHWLDYCSRRLEPALNVFLAELLYRERPDRFAPFDQTRLTHPAVFCLNYCVAQTLIEDGIRPDALLGYSLGELVAWTLAGTLALDDALDLVVDMAVCFEDKTPPASMLAVLAPSALIGTHPQIFHRTELACVNYANNFVVVGAPHDLAVAERAITRLDIPCQILPITRGFHSHFLDPAEDLFLALVSRLKFQPEKLPIFSSMLARQTSLADLTPQHFWNVIRRPVKFWETVRLMESQTPSVYIDIGPSGTLAAFVRQIITPSRSSAAIPLLTPFGRDLHRFEKLRADLGLD